MRRWLMAAAAALIATACGGKVAVDGGATATGTGGAGDPCEAVCATLAAKGCAGADCVARCGNVQGDCPPVADALIACLRDQAASAANCFVEACTAERDALQTCAVTGPCESPILTGDAASGCVGKGICAAGQEHAAVCTPTGECHCFLDNVELGQCQESGPYLCDQEYGCCGVFFVQEF